MNILGYLRFLGLREKDERDSPNYFLFLTFSCTFVKEKEHLHIPERFKYQSKAETKGAPELSKWWEDFNDPALEGLVKEAIKNNYDIRLATERVIEARANLGVSKAQLFPTINLKAEISRSKQGQQPPINTFGVTPVATYELDIWGRLSSSKKASYQRLISVEENRKTIINTVIADVVSLYLEKVEVERKINLQNAWIENNKKVFEIIERRYKRGLSPYLDLLQARNRLLETQSSIPTLERRSQELSQRISILIGKYPEEINLKGPQVDYLETLRPVVAGLPSGLLLRRPDLRKNKAQVDAIFEELKVAMARRFPQITLTGSYGWRSDELKSLFQPESLFWQLSMGLLQPIFDAKGLKSAEEAAHSRYCQAIMSYAQAVLQAFYEVENALMKREHLYKERSQILELIDEVKKTYKTALSRYERGLVDFLIVLKLEDQLFQAKERLVNIETAILKNRVFLYRALGGNWIEEELEGT